MISFLFQNSFQIVPKMFPKCSQNVPKTSKRHPKMFPKWSQHFPKCSQHFPQCSENIQNVQKEKKNVPNMFPTSWENVRGDRFPKYWLILYTQYKFYAGLNVFPELDKFCATFMRKCFIVADVVLYCFMSFLYSICTRTYIHIYVYV